MKYNLRRPTALLLALVFVLSLLPVTAQAVETEELNPNDYGLINQYHVGTTAVTDAYLRGEALELNGVNVSQPSRDLPSSYDSRNSNIVTSVKNQNPYGSCWAHAAMACIESYMIKYGVPVGTGAAATTSLNLSETQHCFFNYSTAYDAEGMTEGDKCTLTGGDSCLDAGGNGEMSAYTLHHWTGAADESQSALQYSKASTVASSGLNSQYCYQYNICHVQNSEWIPGDNIAAVKQAIMDYGAGNISYYETGNAYTYSCTIDTSSQSSSSHKWANHAITVIGWDDSIAASNFRPNTPSSSGAWLCKNSWGTSQFSQGYCWISYEDTSVREGYIYFYDAEPIDNYAHNYQYDGSCNVVTYGIGNRTGFANNTKVANIFTAKGNEVLRAVALCNWDEALTYTVEIYKNPAEGSPDSGTLMSTQTGTLTFSGYYTIELDTPVTLGAGETFSVVINQYVPVADDAGKYVHTPYDANFNDSSLVSWANWTHVNHGNTSYYKEPNGAWTDCPDNGDYRIKAFTDDITFNLTAVSNNEAWGTVSVAGSIITAAPAEGYYAESCDVLEGTATCTINGNTITVAADSDCTVQVNFAPKPSYTVQFVASGYVEGSQNALIYDEITLPDAVSITVENWTFSGWMEQRLDETTDKPAYLAPGASYTVTGDATLFALFTRVEEGTGGILYQLSDGPEDGGKFIIVAADSISGSTGYAVGNTIVANNHYLSAPAITVNSDNTVTASTSNLPNVLWEAASAENGFTFYNQAVGKYMGLDASEYLYPSDTPLAWAYTANGYLDNQTDSEGYYYLSYASANGRYTTSKNGAVINFYKETNNDTVFYWTDPIAGEHEHELVCTPAAAPTCGADGNIEYYRCSICGKYFTDANAENEITQAETVIPATGEHVFGAWSSNNDGTHKHICEVCGAVENEACAFNDEVVAPTPADQGYTVHTCGVCGYSFQDSFVPALGYDYTVHFSVPAGVEQPADQVSNTNTGITLPTVAAPEDYEFLGWVIDSYDNVSVCPETILTGNYIAQEEITLKALFTYSVSEGETETGFYLITDPAVLAAQDQIVITANGSTNYSLSKTQNSNNRGAVAGTKSSDQMTFVPNAETAILTLGTGTVAGSFSLYDPDHEGYLYAASSYGNYLRIQTTLDANGSWKITISGKEASLVAQGSNSRKNLRYNSSSRVFSCYSSGQQSVYIYRLEEHEISTPYYTTEILGQDPVDVYFVDQDGNAAAYAYAFGDGAQNAAFPGELLTALGQDENGDSYYKITLNRSRYTNVIFSGGDSATQTADLGLGDGAHIIYYVNDHTGYVGSDIWPAPGVGVEPTCTEPGSVTYTGMFTGEEHTAELEALGHDYVAVVTEPTCTEGGYTTHTCSRCSDSYTDGETDALGHDWGEWTVYVAPTCTVAGANSRTCSRCDEVDYQAVASLGHDYVPTVTEPTCIEAGYTTFNCSRCDSSFTDNETEALGHLPGEPVQENYVAPTETEAGGYDTVVYCQRCSAELSREHTVLPVLEVLEDGYYLMGTHNNWDADKLTDACRFHLSLGNPDEFILETVLTVGQEFKVVRLENSAVVEWFPNNKGNYVVDADHAGPAVIYFRNSYWNDWSGNGGYFWVGGKDAVSYLDENGETQSCAEYVSANFAGEAWTGWIVLTEDTTLNARIEVSGDACLILEDGKTLNARAGIHIPEDASLTIYAQEGGSGAITADLDMDFEDEDFDFDLWLITASNAAIGGNSNEDGGELTINGGVITVAGGAEAAGIGGGLMGSMGLITINGGTVTASGAGDCGDGIGAGDSANSCPDIVINGGTVTACGGGSGAGIGSHNDSAVTINGGTVNAYGGVSDGGVGAAGIGGNYVNMDAGIITINGGTVNAFGGDGVNANRGGAGIGGASGGNAGTITINGGVVNATGGENGGSGIGPGAKSFVMPFDVGSITITGGQVTATAANAAGIGFSGVFTPNNGDPIPVETNTILGWTEATDFILASGFAGSVTLDDDFAVEGSDETFAAGPVEDNAALANKKLIPPASEPAEPVLDPNISIFSSLSLGIEITASISVRVAQMNACDHWYVQVDKLDADGSVLETQRFGEGQEYSVVAGNVMYEAQFAGISAKEMGVSFEASVHCFDAAGNETYNYVERTSFREYIINELLNTGNADKTRTLCADMLNYAAAAQVFFGYDVEHLVNADLSAEAAAAMEQFATTEEPAADLNNTNSTNMECSVSVMNRVVVSIVGRRLNAGDAVVTFEVKDSEGNVRAVLDTVKHGSAYVADYAELDAADMREPFTFTALVNGVATGEPAIWSLEGYVKEARAVDLSTLDPETQLTRQKELALLNALLVYVDSVKNLSAGR